ncbi:MAG: cyclodeaminase/cyclohydrolase family protein, partial [Acidobacteria bacterium]|nr:cyclodeaminase/cyclohydrolase family protein [Acidobacteriota bacterium]
MSLTSLTVNQILDAFASSDPTPGGGSAAALSGAVAASLLAMVAAMPKTKTGADGERKTLGTSGLELQKLRKRLTELIDEDTKAYDMVTSAYRQPKGTDEEKAVRRAAVQEAMRAATEAPLEVMRACRDAV